MMSLRVKGFTGQVILNPNQALFYESSSCFCLGGPYAAFGGRDASRGLATFSVSCVKDDYDDLSDLNAMEMDSVREWEAQFKGKSRWLKISNYYGYSTKPLINKWVLGFAVQSLKSIVKNNQLLGIFD